VLTVKNMAIPMDRNYSLLRLLHLVSPTLPTGAFSYSQGLEWAVEAGWVHDSSSLAEWLSDLIQQSLAYVDIPILFRMYISVKEKQYGDLEHWCSTLLACRESSELQQEERVRGRALTRLLHGFGLNFPEQLEKSLNHSQLVGFAFAAVKWDIDIQDAALGYTWAWLENQVLAGIKIIPLGQTEGQCVLLQLSSKISEVVKQGTQIKAKEIGAASSSMAIACSLHENQYTRLYRS